MKYVKLTAKPDTWFVEGTEAFDYEEYGKRISVEVFEKDWKPYGMILLRGLRKCEFEYEFALGYKNGEIRQDGESCAIDEFDLEIVDEEYDKTKIPS